jgi:ABC-type xylose transport system permease subunit
MQVSFSHAFHIPYPFYPSWFDYYNDMLVYRGVKIIKLLTVQFSPVSSNFHLFGFIYSFQ